MKRFLLLILGASLIGGLFFIPVSCTSDNLPEPDLGACDTMTVSYNLQIKDIIDTNCAIPTCHIPGGGAPGNYDTYNNMSPFLTDREFKRYVIDLRNDSELGMPPDWDTNPGPKDLTQEEFDLVNCWINQGYPED